jgi:hypothetical protein
MSEDSTRHDKANPASGVMPVLFSASTDTHDTAVVVTNREAMRRSPFGPETAAKAASGE